MEKLGNQEIEKFIEEIYSVIETQYKTWYPALYAKGRYTKPTYTEGRNYFKIINDGSCWGFVSKINRMVKKSPVQIGDLLKPASWSSPAKHSRGNILNGTAMFTSFGPEYLK